MLDWIIKYWLECAFGVVVAGLTAYCKHLSTQVKKEKEERKALRDGMRSLLRRQIIMDCEGAIKNGFCPAMAKDTIEDMYKSYHALGGNGVVTHLREQMLGLPTVKE